MYERIAAGIERGAKKWHDKRDERDLLMVADALRDGDVRTAEDRAHRLDTIVRDQIPAAFWRMIERRNKRRRPLMTRALQDRKHAIRCILFLMQEHGIVMGEIIDARTKKLTRKGRKP
jgi:hypothetical protein